MEVTELYNLTKWVDDQVLSDTHGPLLENYQHFLNALRNAQSGQPFAIEREKLTDALEDINFLGLTRHQKEFLDRLNILQTLGHPAIKTIETILTRNRLDHATAISKVEELRSNLEKGLNKIGLIREGLENYISEDETGDEEGILTRLSFCNNASINNVADLKKAANDWYIIGRGLAEICDSRPEDIKIIGASRGSMIFDLSLFLAVAIALDKIVSSVLNNTKTYLEIQEIKLKIKALKSDSEGITTILDAASTVEEEEKEKIVNNTVEKIIKEYKIEEKNQANIKIAVELLSKFLDQGGLVDFVLPPQEETGEDEVSEEQQTLSDFRRQVVQTRALSENVHQLRLPPPENDTEQDDQIDDELEEQSDDDQEQE